MPRADGGVAAGARVVVGRARRRLARTRLRLAAWARALAHRWRSSMQLRVVTSALALGVVTVVLLGLYLSFSIRDGLFEQRLEQVERENAAMTEQVRQTFSSSPATSSDELQLLLSTMIQTLDTGASSGQDFFLLSSVEQSRLIDVVTRQPLRELITPELREATVASDGQVLQSVLIPAEFTSSEVPEPGVVVGSTVDVPTVGAYELYALYSFQPEQETLSFVQRTLAIGYVAVLVALVALTWTVTRQTVTPVRRAATVAARLADGHLDERMAGSRGEDEMALLARTFNEMATNLQDQIVRMEALSAAQRRFTSDVSHELRTPLTTMRMAGEVIHASRDELDPAARRSAELLYNQLDRFEELLSDLLEISRFDAGAAVLDVEQTDLRSIVTAVADTTAPLAERRGVFLSVDLPTEAPTADVDSRRVERILRNLVVNAIEHAEGKPVEVSVAADAKAVAVVVRDHGVGMTAVEAEHVFDRFWRADPARARTTGGTGLGLSIALEDARLHGGWLEAWGRPGEGASFRLTLPRRAGIQLQDSPLALVPPSRGMTQYPTGQIPVVNPPTGPTPTAIPDLDAHPLEDDVHPLGDDAHAAGADAHAAGHGPASGATTDVEAR